MSDQTRPSGGADDFRGSAADKRRDETVMVNAEDLSNLVANAKQAPDPPPEPAQAPAAVRAIIPTTTTSIVRVAVLAAILVLVVLAVVVATAVL